MNPYEANGYKDRKDYLQALAEQYDIKIEIVEDFAELLGPSEDFDGLVNMLEDVADGGF